MHMKKLNGSSSGVEPLCVLDFCGNFDQDHCWLWDTCKVDWSPPCSFIDRCNVD